MADLNPKDIIGVNNLYLLEMAKGEIKNHEGRKVFGVNADLSTGVVATLSDGETGLYVPPTQARIHAIVSDNVLDTATVLSSGSADESSTLNTLTDLTATFTSDGVAAGDLVLNDTTTEICLVVSVPSENTMITSALRSPLTGKLGDAFVSGDTYRIVTGLTTGSGVVLVEGLDASFLEQCEFVIFDGTTPTNTVLSYVRMFGLRGFGANSLKVVGTVTATAATDGTVSASILDGNNQSLTTVYTIPMNKNGYLFADVASLAKKQSATVIVTLRAGTLNGMGYMLNRFAVSSTGTSALTPAIEFPNFIPSGTDVWMEGDSDANSVGVSAGYTLILVDLADD